MTSTRARFAHLTVSEREIIRRMLGQKCSHAVIARVLGKSRTTVRREIKRNTNGADIYYEKHAQAFMLRRRRKAKEPSRVIENDIILEQHLEELLKRTYSPEQISGYLRRVPHRRLLCHMTIYRWVHRRWQTRKLYLRFKGRPRAPYGSHKIMWQPHKRHISQRPAIVQKRRRVGDWEADLVHGTRDGSRHSLLTLNDRATGFCVLRKLTTLNPLTVAYIISHALKGLPVETITCDNGFEFARHKVIEQRLKCRVYFTDTHSPQQRGSNENLNGLIREFFPKGTSMAHVTETQVMEVSILLNRRPRKRLGYDCPRNVFAEMTGMSHYIVR